MPSINLEAERLQAISAVRSRHLSQLRQLGVEPTIAAHLWEAEGAIGVAHAELIAAGFYQPLPDRRPNAFIQPVEDEAGNLIDLCAWHCSRPDIWALRTGTAQYLGRLPALGSWEGSVRLRIFETPLDWLKAGGKGVTLLDWAFAPNLLRFQSLIVDRPSFGNKLLRAVTKLPRAPEIIIASSEGLKNAA